MEERATNPFARLPKEIILQIFMYAMPSLQYKNVIAQAAKPGQLVDVRTFPYYHANVPEAFSNDLVTYIRLFKSCKTLNEFLKEDSIVISMRYLQDQKRMARVLKSKTQEELRDWVYLKVK